MTKNTKKAKPSKPAAKPAAKASKAPAADTNKIGKSQLTHMVAAKTGLNNTQSDHAVGAMLESIADALKAGKAVGLPGVGTLSVRATAARTGVRPGTSEKINIPAGRKVGFKISTTLKGEI